ncbi:hypothetical protein DWU99_18415 [Dyella psychrodurans]|uniref:Uncharacterized protein n=1 Tax=Dyella psychrodurans TaxID=1927960 RepID=A0A370WYI0_9GAMM|nr:hypothetical protein DWU99_18415 [Dyella psychrodurans]
MQLEAQTLRLRVDEAELAQLLSGSVTENRTQLPDGRTEIQQLQLAASPHWQRNDATWLIGLPEWEVRALSERLPSREGLQFDLPTPSGGTLQVLFDVDVRDSTRRRMHKSSEGDAS